MYLYKDFSKSIKGFFELIIFSRLLTCVLKRPFIQNDIYLLVDSIPKPQTGKDNLTIQIVTLGQ